MLEAPLTPLTVHQPINIFVCRSRGSGRGATDQFPSGDVLPHIEHLAGEGGGSPLFSDAHTVISSAGHHPPTVPLSDPRHTGDSIAAGGSSNEVGPLFHLGESPPANRTDDLAGFGVTDPRLGDDISQPRHGMVE